MTPPKPAPRPRSVSPQERSIEQASHQQKLKEEAAARREQQQPKPRPTGGRR